jgi:tRNA threonylcarbamoyladenosine biosynthesis protein TsaB
MRLAIDTSTEFASVAIGASGAVTDWIVRCGAREHAAQLVPMIHEVLARTGVQLADIAEIVVGDGPGSFTGLRIGWAAAKGLAHERGIPLVAIPSLLGVAHAASGVEKSAGPIAACSDALRGQVFGAVYAFHPHRVETLVGPALFTLAELARVTPVRPVLAVGDGAERYRTDVETWTGKPPMALADVSGIARSLLLLADDEAARRLLDDARAEPIYGRPAEAQAKWEARHGRPLPNSPR